MSRKFLQYQKDCVNQVLKAAMAINAQTLSEMEIPENYIDSLPKVKIKGKKIPFQWCIFNFYFFVFYVFILLFFLIFSHDPFFKYICRMEEQVLGTLYTKALQLNSLTLTNSSPPWTCPLSTRFWTSRTELKLPL